MEWTKPWEYDIPPVFTSSMMDGLMGALKQSIRAITDNAFIVFGFLAVFLILIMLLKHFAHVSSVKEGVNKRSLSRQIFREDVKNNLDDMVDDGVLKKKVSYMVNDKFHKNHMDLEVRNRVNSMEVSHAAEQEFHKKNPNAFAEKKDLYKKMNDNYYKSRGGRGHDKKGG